jgi:hypothetical protein
MKKLKFYKLCTKEFASENFLRSENGYCKRYIDKESPIVYQFAKKGGY